MVLCYKCSDEKHDECMEKFDMLNCDCQLCKSQNIRS